MKTLAFTVAGALGLKLWLRDAGVEQLQWLLKPTVLLSEVLSQTRFTFERGVLAVHLHHVSFGWLTAPRLHEAIGVMVYLSMLVLATQLLNHRVPA